MFKYAFLKCTYRPTLTPIHEYKYIIIYRRTLFMGMCTRGGQGCLGVYAVRGADVRLCMCECGVLLLISFVLVPWCSNRVSRN